MGLLIDSSILIDAERGRLELGSQISERPDEEFFLSAVSASELLHGVHRAGDPVTRARRSAFVEALLAELPVLPLDILAARTHARLWAELASEGTAVGAQDLWIAATCVGRGLTLVTGDARDFERVPGLEMEVWS